MEDDLAATIDKNFADLAMSLIRINTGSNASLRVLSKPELFETRILEFWALIRGSATALKEYETVLSQARELGPSFTDGIESCLETDFWGYDYLLLPYLCSKNLTWSKEDFGLYRNHDILRLETQFKWCKSGFQLTISKDIEKCMRKVRTSFGIKAWFFL